MLLALLCLVPQARAEEHPLDEQMRRLSVMSQRDETIADIKYSNVDVRQAGCKPVSLVNGMVASLGVTDREVAAALVRETISLLVPQGQKNTGVVNLHAVNRLFEPERRWERKSGWPGLETALAPYEGRVQLLPGKGDVQAMLNVLAEAEAPLLLVGTMGAYPDWADVIRVASLLHERGMDDATISLSCLSAGRDAHAAPLRLGKYGHYLSVLVPVGAFLSDGTVYVLDSMPRALEGEPYGGKEVLRAQYAFVANGKKDRAFNENFEAVRISPTVIRLSLRPQALDTLRQAAPEQAEDMRRAMMRPLEISGSGMALVTLGR